MLLQPLREFLGRGSYWKRVSKMFILASAFFLIGETTLYWLKIYPNSERYKARFFPDLLVIILLSLRLAWKKKRDNATNSLQGGK